MNLSPLTHPVLVGVRTPNQKQMHIICVIPQFLCTSSTKNLFLKFVSRLLVHAGLLVSGGADKKLDPYGSNFLSAPPLLSAIEQIRLHLLCLSTHLIVCIADQALDQLFEN